MVAGSVPGGVGAEEACYDAGDVLIIGAGASGISAAEALVQRGFDVTLVDQEGIGAGQSAHSHGYLHRGYIYLRPRDSLVRYLQQASASWERTVARKKIPTETSESLIVFTSAPDADHAYRAWELAGLREHARIGMGDNVNGTTDWQSVFAGRGAERFARSPEKVIDFSRIAAGLVDKELAGCRFIHGKVGCLQTLRDRVLSAEVDVVGRGRCSLVAGLYLITAGGGARMLVRATRGHAGSMLVRQSYMLALRHNDLPHISAVFPGAASYGLFIAPRRDASGRTIWLISNHASFHGLDHGQAGPRLWVRQVARTLTEYTRVIEFDGIEWAWYPAPKGEFVTGLDRPRLDGYGWANAAVAFPTKLTLVPGLVDYVLPWVWGRRAEIERRRPSTVVAEGTGLQVAKELWRSCRWHEGESLVGLRDARGASVVPEWRAFGQVRPADPS